VLLTSIERALIDTRVAQRLRYVAQSGLAQLVFPEVRLGDDVRASSAPEVTLVLCPGEARVS